MNILRAHEVSSTCRGDFADPYVFSYLFKKFHRVLTHLHILADLS